MSVISFAELALMEKVEEAMTAGHPLLFSNLDKRDQDMYKALKSKGLVARSFDGAFIQLTPSGLSALETAHDKRQEAEAAASREQKSIRRSWWQVIVTAILAAVFTELVSLLVRHIFP